MHLRCVMHSFIRSYSHNLGSTFYVTVIFCVGLLHSVLMRNITIKLRFLLLLLLLLLLSLLVVVVWWDVIILYDV